MAIKFGTDGWRAKMADDFTEDNVRLVTQALVNFLQQKGLAAAGVAVGYDNRLNSENFARVAAEVVSGAGIKAFLTNHAVPSPVLSYAVKSQGLGAGIMITASHNPPDYNGFKIKEGFGGSAFPETTKGVEANLSAKLSILPSSANFTEFDPDPAYFEKLKELVDIEKINAAGLRVIVDPMHGSGAGYFQRLGVKVVEIRGNRDTTFGGINPEPLAVNLQSSMEFVKAYGLKHSGLTACIVLDGDADRIAAIDQSGTYVNTHNIFSLLLKHLYENRHFSGAVVKTFNISNLVDSMCAEYKLRLDVRPIGFKYIAKEMLEGPVILGGEESGGMGIQGFIPERDGILAGLMLLELMAKERKTLLQIVDGLMKKYGYYYYNRKDIHTTVGPAIVEGLKKTPPTDFAGKKIAKVETLDGLKFTFENKAWILFRASGTEPLLRIYSEGRTPEEVELLLSAGVKLAA
ncbi:MAG: phosphoglucomutase/phosphomannomutase family protein [Candidatus Margulisiibacteriota bacterium]